MTLSYPRVIGSGTWDCGGCRITPDVRIGILTLVVNVWEQYELFTAETHQHGANAPARLERPVTVEDLMDRPIGDWPSRSGSHRMTFAEDLQSHLMDYLCDEGGLEFEGDNGNPHGDDYPEAFIAVWHRIGEWVSPLALRDVLAWWNSGPDDAGAVGVEQPEMEHEATDWRIMGF